MKSISSLFAAASLLAATAFAGELNVTSPINRQVCTPGALDITWDMRSDSNHTLEEFMNITISLWYLPYGNVQPPSNVQGTYLLDILGVAPATDKQFTANIPNDIGPEGRLYKVYVNATPAGFGFSQSDLFVFDNVVGTNASAMAKGANVNGYSAANAVNPLINGAMASTAVTAGGLALMTVAGLALAF